MSSYKVRVFSKEETIEVRELPLPEPGEGEVLLRIKACAICTLEQRVYKGGMKMYPFAGGHEIAGEVVKLGAGVKSLAVGDRVAPRMLNSCGSCYYCRSGHEHQCVVSFRTQAHEGILGPGGFSDYMLVKASNAFKMSADLDFAKIALTEPLACCVHSVQRGDIGLAEDVVVIGVGIMGAFHIQLAKLRGARVIACEIDEGRLEVARRLGADVLVNSAKEDPVARVKEVCNGDGAEVVFCTAALPDLAEQAVAMADKMGRVILYSSFHPNRPIAVDPNAVHSRETVITGSLNPNVRDFFISSRLLSGRIINVDPLISAVYPMEKLEDAVRKAVAPDSYRVVATND